MRRKKEKMEIKASYHQTRLWFNDLFEAGRIYEASPIYHNIPLIFRLKGKVVPTLLEKSINAVIYRHGALRTRLINQNNEPLQVIEPEATFKLEQVNQAVDPLDLAIKFTQKAFNLDKAPLLRASLIGISSEESLLAVSLHHIIADRYSLGIITNEIFAHYDAYIKEETPYLQPLTLHYADFSQWQYSLTDEMLEPIIYYWKKILKSPLHPLEFPTDRPKTVANIYHEGHRQFKLNENRTAQIEQFCQQCQTSKELLFLSIFKILLAKYSGQEEIIVGISDANRNQPGLEQIVGPIANLLVLRSCLDESQTLLQVFENTRETIQNARKYKDIPYERLEQELKLPRDAARNALFDVLFEYREKPWVKILPRGLDIDILETNLGYGKYDLHLLIHEDKNNASIISYLVYNRDYYDSIAIARFINHYIHLLENSLENPHCKISELNFLTEQEKDQILHEFNTTPAEFPRDKTIQRIFEEQVEKNPGGIAVIDSTMQMTYYQLHETANRLAHQLKENGVGVGIIVALILERTFEMIIGIMAVLKAGGAYLPIDPYYPQERIRFIIKDSGAKILLNEHLGIEVFERTWNGSSRRFLVPASGIQPHNLAYVIYTSGTTGRPKGALIEHRNIIQLLFHESFPFHFDSTDTWSFFHSYCFDFSVWEMYGALLYGGKLLIIPRLAALDTKRFLEMLYRYNVTVLNQTPSAFYRLNEEELKISTPGLALKYTFLGGEVLNVGKLKVWRARYPHGHLIILYGITETTILVTYKEITAEEIKLSFSSIGKPFPTYQVYIVDKQRQLVPIGVPGEMLVGGSGVCRGYLNRPELTLEKFLKNYRSYESYRTDILYKTGDLARMLDNGEIIYLGRIDKQIKIHGHRIELGEIENRLHQYGPVKDTVVIDREDKNGQQYLCAYVVLHSADPSLPPVRTSELRSYLLKRLPEYMIPSNYVLLDRIPLTANGKVDRGALPAPEIDADVEYIAPRNEVERGIVYILSEVMGIDKNRISVRANFLDIGINSVTLLKIAHRISEEFRIDFPISTLFINQTVEEVVEE